MDATEIRDAYFCCPCLHFFLIAIARKYLVPNDISPKPRWAHQKYKKLRGHLRRATHWVARIARRDSKLWAHWQMGVRRGSMAGAV